MSATIIVPARLASSRFPEKLLHKVHNKPLILWTAERIRQEAPEYPLWFAVDGDLLANLLSESGFEVVCTDPELPSGTDRIASANQRIGASRVINLQADEPLISGNQIRMLDQLLGSGTDMATLGRPILDNDSYHNPNHVKMVRSTTGQALYFSRSPIPYIRDTAGQFTPSAAGSGGLLIHLGLYAYTAEFLEVFASLPVGHLEALEKLEMLRALENGYSIATGVTQEPTIGIDTPEDIVLFESALRTIGHPSRKDPL